MQKKPAPVLQFQEQVAKEEAELRHLLEADQEEQVAEYQIKPPEWFTMLIAATGILDLMDKIQAEKDRRADEEYQNPFDQIEYLVTSLPFEGLVGFVITVNCVAVGFQFSLNAESTYERLFYYSEQFFTTFFLVEWLLRIIAHGWTWLFTLSNAYDTAMTLLFVIINWLGPFIGPNLQILRTVTVLRALRLTRLSFALRLQPGFKELWIMVNGVLSSVKPMVWIWVMGLLLLWIWGVVATELIGYTDQFHDNLLAQFYFGDPAKSMLTLFQVMTVDTWTELIARPILRENFYLALFFVGYIIIGLFVYWNLVIGIVVDNAFAQTKADHELLAMEVEARKSKTFNKLLIFFLDADKDGSGELSLAEFKEIAETPEVESMLKVLELSVESLENAWKFMIDDEDGLLTPQEFLAGIKRMQGRAKAKDVKELFHRISTISSSSDRLQHKVTSLYSSLHRLEDETAKTSNDLREVCGLFQEIHIRLQNQSKSMDKKDEERLAQREKVRIESLKNEVLQEPDDEEDEEEELAPKEADF